MGQLSRTLSIGMLLLGAQVFGLGQSVTLTIGSGSGTAGSTVSLPITVTSSGGAQTAGLQWAFVYSSDITSVTVVAGPSATNAGKSVTCNGNTCLVFGFNSTAMANGTVATATFQIAASPSTTTIPVQLSGVVASTAVGDSIPASGGAGTISLPAAQATPSSINCAPATINPPGNTQCTVTLTGAAPSGGLSVSLSSNNANLTVPSTVTVSAGQTSANFTASAAQVSSSQTATVTATANSVARGTTVTLSGPPAINSFTCSPGSVNGPGSASCTIGLSAAAPSGGSSVSLNSNNTSVTLPPSVTVSSGQTGASFTATVAAVATNQSALLTATLGSSSQQFNLTINAPAQFTSISCSPSTLGSNASSLCTASLSGPANGAVTVSLGSSSSALTVPASVNISSGQSSATFSATTAAVSTSQTVTITGNLNSLVRTTTISLTTSTQLSSLSCSPASLTGSGAAICTVSLTGAAPSGGFIVALTSDSTSVTVPPSVTVGANQTSATFTATAAAVTANQNVLLSATLNAVSQQFNLAIDAPGLTQPSGLSCSPATVAGPGTSLCTVTVSSAANANTVVNLSSNDSHVTVPATVTVGSGQLTATFTATAAAVTSDIQAQITASVNNGSRQFVLAVTAPSTGIQISSLNCSPSALSSSTSAQCNLSLNAPATSAVSIALHSDKTDLVVPLNVAVAAGSSSATFLASAQTVTASHSATVTASLIGKTQAAVLSLLPRNGFKSLTCLPSFLDKNGTATCNLQVTQPAISAIPVTLSSSDGYVSVPASVTIPAQGTSITFPLQVGYVANPKAVSILALMAGDSVVTYVQVLQGVAPTLAVPDRITAYVNGQVTFTATASDSDGSPVALSAANLPPGAVFDPKTGTFLWTPSVAQIGSYGVSITATNTATGVSSGAFVVINVQSGKAQLTGLLNSATFASADVCSPGAIGTLVGSGFTGQPPKTAAGPNWPTELAGVQVKVNGQAVPILFASDTLINFECPKLPTGTEMSISVKPAQLDAPAPLATTMEEATPGIFLLDGVQAAVLIAGTNEIAMPATDNIPSRPVKPGEFISIYANGLGPLQEPLDPGVPAPLDHPVYASDMVRVVVGTNKVELVPSFVGLTPGMVSMYVVNVQLPLDIQTGPSVPISLNIILSDWTVRKSNVGRIAIDSSPQ